MQGSLKRLTPDCDHSALAALLLPAGAAKAALLLARAVGSVLAS